MDRWRDHRWHAALVRNGLLLLAVQHGGPGCGGCTGAQPRSASEFRRGETALSPPEDLAKWDAVVAALAKCPRWDPFNIPGWKGPRVGEPIPDGVRTHLAAKKAELEILISAVDALPEAGVWLRDRVGLNTKQYEIRPAIEVIGVLCDALVLHRTELEAGERLLRAARVVPGGNPGAVEYYTRNILVSQVIHALLWVGFKGKNVNGLLAIVKIYGYFCKAGFGVNPSTSANVLTKVNWD